jgi:hypothetical protein
MTTPVNGGMCLSVVVQRNRDAAPSGVATAASLSMWPREQSRSTRSPRRAVEHQKCSASSMIVRGGLPTAAVMR